MTRSVIDIENVGKSLTDIVRNLSIDGKRVVAEEMMYMARYGFPQAVLRFYPTVLKVRTGRLRQSFEGFSERADDKNWRIGMRSRNVEYATIQHDGGKTPPCVIKPRNKKALYWSGAKHPVKSVNHPGSTIKATKFFSKPMTDEIDPMIKRILSKVEFRS